MAVVRSALGRLGSAGAGQKGGGTHGDERLTENVSLNFRKFKYEYTAQTDKGGAGETAQFGWDVAGNTET